MSFRPFHENSPLDAPPLSDASAILVVDEDPAFQLGLKTFLREFVGFEKVFTARSGEEALDFIRAEPSIEVVTVDSRLSGMSGIEVLATLRSQMNRPIAALMITGTPTESLKAEFHSLGSDLLLTDDFLSKPVQFEKLEPIVLAAHESVHEAKQRLLERPAEPGEDLIAGETAEPGIAEMIDAQSRRLDALQGEVRAQRGKWRADFAKVLIVALLFWLAGQFGLLQRLEGPWSEFRKSASERIESWIGSGDPAATPNAPMIPAGPPPAGGGETPGQPL